MNDHSTITLSGKRTTCDAVTDITKARIDVEHTCWRGLHRSELIFSDLASYLTNLGVLAALEERSDPYQPNVIIPHDRVLFVISRKLEGVLED